MSVFVNDNIKSFLNPEVSYNSNSIEIVSIFVKLNESDLIIIGCYRPHNGTSKEFITDLKHVLNNLNLHNKRTILLGDLNISLLHETQKGNTSWILCNPITLYLE